jgi:hypothetical protein
MKYSCESESCPYEGPEPYSLELPPEACIDEHNCAVVFCPYCREQMSIHRPGEPPADGR